MLINQIIEGKEIRMALQEARINANQMEEELTAEVLDYMKSEGFPEEEAKEYSRVDVRNDGDHLNVEVGVEISYDGMMDLAERLDKIVSKYDPDAYFEAECPGILVSWVRI